MPKLEASVTIVQIDPALAAMLSERWSEPVVIRLTSQRILEVRPVPDALAEDD
jgi:hypothetical protein